MATIPASENVFPEVLLSEVAAPAAAAAGQVRLYAKADGLPYSKDDAGAETALGAAAHIADTADAHDASAISIADAGALYTATDVEAALAEVMGAVSGGGIPATIFDAQGDLIVASAADTAARLALGASGTVLTSNGTTAAWAAATGGADDPIADVFGAADTAFEFDTSSLTGLTALGTATAEDADTTIDGHYYVTKAATSSPALTGRYLTAPSTPFTVITKVTDHTLLALNFERIGGLFVSEATPGVIEAVHVVHNGDWTVSHVRYTNPTTFSATIGTDLLAKNLMLPLYYGIVVNSTTDVDFWYSFGGRIWKKRTDAYNPSITIGSVGVCVDPENATHGVSGAFDFIRVWNSAKTFPGV